MKHVAFSKLSIAFALLFSLWGSAAYANDYDDVNTLLRQGKSNEALAKADAYIAGKPRDPQMRFLRGVILTEQKKQNEAIAAFTQLTQDFPELPEPYNNLAALYAAQSKFDQARAALAAFLMRFDALYSLPPGSGASPAVWLRLDGRTPRRHQYSNRLWRSCSKAGRSSLFSNGEKPRSGAGRRRCGSSRRRASTRRSGSAIAGSISTSGSGANRRCRRAAG